MQKILYSIAFLLLMITVLSCKDKITIAAPYKDVIVIYGLLDAADTAHYVRIQKAFLDENESAYDMAKVADSNYLKNLSVKVEKINSEGEIDSTFTLTRVDLNKEGYPKDSGAFFNDVNYAYKFTNSLLPAYTYRLVVTNLNTGKADSAETPIIDESKNVFRVSFFNTVNNKIDFSDTASYKLYQLGFTAPATAQIFSGMMRIRWYDVNLSTGDSVLQQRDWNFASTALDYVAPGSNAVTLEVHNLDFYHFLAKAMGPAPTGIVRHMAYNDIFIYAATHDFYEYQLIATNQQNGITGQYVHPNYTNVKGPDALGLFAGRAIRAGYHFYFNSFTINSLMASSIMAGTNIKDK